MHLFFVAMSVAGLGIMAFGAMVPSLSLIAQKHNAPEWVKEWTLPLASASQISGFLIFASFCTGSMFI